MTTAVANGDLSQKITVEARGEVLDLKDTINNMVEKLRIFADEVSASRAKWERKACSAARRTCPASPARGRA